MNIITPKLWTKKKKSNSYDHNLFNMNEQERLTLSDSIADIQF